MEYRKDFDSVEEMVNYAESTPQAGKWAGTDASSQAGSHEWALGATLEDAYRLSRVGWAEGREKFKGHMIDAKSTGAAKVIARAAAFENDVVGSFPDIGAYLSGAPDCMVNVVDNGQTLTEPVVEVNVAMGYLAGANAREISNYGSAIALLIDQLEEDGHSVEVNMAKKARAGSDTFVTKVTAKAAGQPLDIDRLAFVIAHPAVARRILFKVMETVEEAYNSFSFTMGGTVTDDDVHFPSVLAADGHDYRARCRTMEGAVEVVAELWSKR